MTRRNTLLGALAAAGVGTLLWCAWLILAVDLPQGSTIASWALWLLAAAAMTTFVAYVRELTRHEAVRRGGSWRPLPGLVLLWIAGGTAVAAFAFMLPSASTASTGQVRSADRDSSLTRTTTQPGPAATAWTSTSTPRGSTTSVARTQERTAPAPTGSDATPTPVSTTAPRATPGPRTTNPRPSESSPTSTPIVDLTILPERGRQTTKPPHGK